MHLHVIYVPPHSKPYQKYPTEKKLLALEIKWIYYFEPVEGSALMLAIP